MIDVFGVVAEVHADERHVGVGRDHVLELSQDLPRAGNCPPPNAHLG